jgi:N-acetylmuramoyl-L-alanine amidase
MRRPIHSVVALLLAGVLAAGSAAGVRADDVVPPLAGVTIAIDPGHNGGNATHVAQISRLVWSGIAWKPCNTVGTRTASGYAEHRFNFVIALRVKASLEALGAVVHLTRTTDTGVGPCVDVRGRFGADVGADLTVSIHANGSASSHRGFFVMRPGLVDGYTDDIVAGSRRLASSLRAGLLAAGVPIANYYTTTGIKVRRDLATFNLSDVPVVMVELGNMRNAGDARRMTSITGRTRYAAGITEGIRRYLGR